MAPKVRNRWFIFKHPPMTFDDQAKQEFKEECDINVILARYDETGPRPGAPLPRFGDFAEAPDFLAAQLLVKQAEEHFASLDVRIRDRFNHNPVALLSFLGDPANRDEAVKLGLVQAPPPPPPEPGKP